MRVGGGLHDLRKMLEIYMQWTPDLALNFKTIITKYIDSTKLVASVTGTKRIATSVVSNRS